MFIIDQINQLFANQSNDSLADISLQNLIGGELTSGYDAKDFQCYAPATGKVYAKLPNSTQADLDQAVYSAQQAFPKWRSLAAEERAAMLNAIADRIQQHQEIFAKAECLDTGKPFKLANSLDIPRSITNLQFFASAISQKSSLCHDMGDKGFNYTLQDPIGVVACISPWNLPLYLLTWKIAPALATGNCVIAKPSELTPLTAYLLATICKDILPPGVLNILHGEGKQIGNLICKHDGVKAVSFTGGTETGRVIANQIASEFKKYSLELGGKNATVICADADLDKAVDWAVKAGFSNQGQICLCGSRILVEKQIYSQFVDKFCNKVESLKVSDPKQADCDLGAVISHTHMQKVLGYLDYAKQNGGTFLTGGGRQQLSGVFAEGYFVQPTVISDLENSNKLNQEEIFGPVVSLQTFTDDNEAVKLANDVPYGLSAAIMSNNISRCHVMAKQLQVGTVWVNAWMLRDLRVPFGGVKQSGVGREGGLSSLAFFTDTKNICIAY